MHRRPNPSYLPPMVERRERSWVFSAGARQWSFTRTDYRAAMIVPDRAGVTARRGWRPTALLGLMLGAIGSVTLVGVAVTSSRASAGYRYSVSVPVPPARAAYHGPVRDAAATAPQPAPIRTSAPRTDRAARPAQAPSLDYANDDILPIGAPALATTAAAAIDTALATGRLQQWASPDGDERGFVVVGPAEQSGGCRALSILTRRDGDNAVERRRECPGVSLASGRQAERD